jgi:DNA invertase Pin-like site-specific DNA recombinase
MTIPAWPHRGGAVSISADGNMSAVGGNRDNSSQGAVWVFTRSLYAQVSSKDQELGYSVAAQQALLRQHASEQPLSIEEFSDVETAKTVGRPGFNAMLEYLRKHPECRVVLVEKTDRLYRNFKGCANLANLTLARGTGA